MVYTAQETATVSVKERCSAEEFSNISKKFGSAIALIVERMPKKRRSAMLRLEHYKHRQWQVCPRSGIVSLVSAS